MGKRKVKRKEHKRILQQQCGEKNIELSSIADSNKSEWETLFGIGLGTKPLKKEVLIAENSKKETSKDSQPLLISGKMMQTETNDKKGLVKKAPQEVENNYEEQQLLSQVVTTGCVPSKLTETNGKITATVRTKHDLTTYTQHTLLPNNLCSGVVNLKKGMGKRNRKVNKTNCSENVNEKEAVTSYSSKPFICYRPISSKMNDTNNKTTYNQDENKLSYAAVTTGAKPKITQRDIGKKTWPSLETTNYIATTSDNPKTIQREIEEKTWPSLESTNYIVAINDKPKEILHEIGKKTCPSLDPNRLPEQKHGKEAWRYENVNLLDRKPRIDDQDYEKKDRRSLVYANQYDTKVNQNINRFDMKWRYFYKVYETWEKERETSISKLKELVKELHDYQLKYNRANLFFKDLNIGARQLKLCSPLSSNVNFWSTVAASVTDAAGGVAYAFQALNVDFYSTKFKEIMDHDAEITRSLYKARLQCLEVYQDVEKLLRCYHTHTFGDTLSNISKTLRIDDLWLDIKDSKGESSSFIQKVDTFLSRNMNMEVWEKVCNSLQDYVDSNPAALNAYISAGNAAYGIYELWQRNTALGRSVVGRQLSIISDSQLIQQGISQRNELSLLTSDENGIQVELESEINNALNLLHFEMRQISSIF